MTVLIRDNSKTVGPQTVSQSGVDLVARGRQVWESSRSGRDIVEQRWQKSNDLYNAKFSKQEKEWSEFLGQPRLFIAKTYAQIQRILEDVMETIFFDFEEIVSISQWKSIPSESIDIFKNLINYRLNGHPINFYQECFEATLDAIKNKVGILKVYPKLKFKKTKVKKARINESGPDKDDEFDEVNVVDRWSPQIECLPYEDVFFHASATWKNYWEHPIVHRKKVTLDYCKRRGFINLEMFSGGVSAGDSADPIKQQRELQTGSPFSTPQLVEPLNELWIFEVWDFKPVENDGADEMEGGSFILGGSSPEEPNLLLRDWEKNNLPLQFDPMEPVRPPLILGSAFPESHQLYGKDFPEMTEGLQKETNAQRNQEREEVARRLRTPLLVNKNAGLDLMGLMIRKIGGVVQGEDIGPDAVRELLSPPPASTTQHFQARTDMDYAEISSIPPLSMGAQTSGIGSATEFAGLDRNANKKINGIIRNVAMTLFVPAIRYVARYEQEYENDDFIEYVTGQRLGWSFERDKNGNYAGAPPSISIQGDFDYNVNLGVNKETQLNRLRTMVELGNQANANTAQMIQFQVADPAKAKFFNVFWAFKKMAKILGQKNTDEMEIQGKAPPPEPTPGPQKPGVASAPGVSNPQTTAQGDFLG